MVNGVSVTPSACPQPGGTGLTTITGPDAAGHVYSIRLDRQYHKIGRENGRGGRDHGHDHDLRVIVAVDRGRDRRRDP